MIHHLEHHTHGAGGFGCRQVDLGRQVHELFQEIDHGGFGQFFDDAVHPDKAVAHGVDILGGVVFGDLGVHVDDRLVDAEDALLLQIIQLVDEMRHGHLEHGFQIVPPVNEVLQLLQAPGQVAKTQEQPFHHGQDIFHLEAGFHLRQLLGEQLHRRTGQKA